MGRWEAQKRIEEERAKPRVTPPPAPKRVINRRGRTISTTPAGTYGVGGGNAGQAQSTDPTAPAYIKPYSSVVDDDGGGSGVVPTGRDAPEPSGGGARGTQTGFKGFPIDLDTIRTNLGREIADVNNFVSTQLPTVDVSGKQFDAKERPDGTYDAPEMVVVGGKAVKFSDLDQALNDTVVEGSSTPGRTSLTPADTADNKRVITIDRDFGDGARGDSDERTDFSRDYGDYEGTDYSPIRQARRAAFLSGDDGPGSSVRAVRDANNSVGTFRSGGNYYVNDGGTLRQVTKEAYGKANTSGLTAEELKNAYIQPIKETLVPVATKDGFETSTQVPEIYDSGISTKPDVPKGVSGLSYNQQTEFNMNNLFPGEAKDYDLESPVLADRARMKSNYFSRDDDDDE